MNILNYSVRDKLVPYALLSSGALEIWNYDDDVNAHMTMTDFLLSRSIKVSGRIISVINLSLLFFIEV